MQFMLKNCFENGARSLGSFGSLTGTRWLSSQEISTCLRPFYFSVHPDLFGKFPEQREINENSLKLLSAHLEALQNQKRILPGPSNLPFYMKPENKSKNELRLIKVPIIRDTDTKVVLRNILEACNLSTEFIDKIPSRSSGSPRRTFTANPNSSNPKYKYEFDNLSDEDFDLFQLRVRNKKEQESLQKWIRKNFDIATIRTKSLEELKEEVHDQKNEIVKKLGLVDIIYDCGWDFGHFRGCLKSLDTLHKLYEDDFKYLIGKTVIFGSFTGVSLSGEIMLFTGDVQNNWLDLIKNGIPKHEIYLSTFPMYESTLSQVLLNIKIKRRKFMPKALAREYSSHLKRLITTLLDYLTKHKYPESWPKSLENFELVVESESGPLMLSPVGQLITPSTCPASIFVDFITKNLDEAKIRQEAYQKNKYVERDLFEKCIKQLRLRSLKKDDNIEPQMAINCMERLLASDIKLKNLNLLISTYYSITNDGTISIPHDFQN